MRSIPVPHGHLHVELGGELTGTPVVFLHAFSLDHRLWQAEVQALSRHRLCVSYDLRGFGRSSLPDPAHPFAHHEDLRSLLDALGLDRVGLVGLSMGGAVAVDFALAHPGRVHRVVVIGSALGGWPPPDDDPAPWSIWELGKSQGIAAAKRAWLDAPVMRASGATAEAQARVRQMVAEWSGWQFANDTPLVRLEPPAAARLESLAAPILALVGERDLPLFHQIAAAIALRAPAGRTQVVPDAGHLTNLDAPAAVLEAISGFLDVGL
jgi:pimeloyl-ACP methyl ester carboxylesterase